MICFIRLHFFARFFRRGFAPSDFPTSKGSTLAGHSQRACGPEDTAALDRLELRHSFIPRLGLLARQTGNQVCGFISLFSAAFSIAVHFFWETMSKSVVHLSKDFFVRQGKALESVAELRREHFDAA